MQCGLTSINDCERSPNRAALRVNFSEKGEAVKERREKFLTAKYGAHQMALIRKRLAVEMWMYDELLKLFGTAEEVPDVDIDEILDMDNDDMRISYLMKICSVSKSSKHDVAGFIDNLLGRTRTL